MPSCKCQRIVWKVWSLLQSQGNLTLFTDMQKWRNIYLNYYFSLLCQYLFCETYVVQRPESTISMMNVMFVVFANRAPQNVIEDVNSKDFSLA